MPHFRVDDGLHAHPKVVKAGDEAIGFWARAGAYCMAYLTDGFVPEWWVKSQPRGQAKARKLVDAGLWTPCQRDNQPGWEFHEWRQDSKVQVEADRRSAAARQQVFRNSQLREKIRARDQDICRYCGVTVEWHNRRGSDGGTYDHVDPDGQTTLDNLVVCCRGCNTRKGRRTPAQAGMTLIQISSKSDLNQDSRSDLEKKGKHPGIPNPTQPNPTLITSSYLERGTHVSSGAGPDDPPPRFCPEHMPDGTPLPCGACRHHRETREAWDRQHAATQTDQLAAFWAEVRACPDCDPKGHIEDHGRVRRCQNHNWPPQVQP